MAKTKIVVKQTANKYGLGGFIKGFGKSLGIGWKADIQAIDIRHKNRKLLKDRIRNDQMTLNNVEGIEYDNLYAATGGTLNPPKGRVVASGVVNSVKSDATRLSSNTALVKGATHDEGGIQIPGGEIENNEVIKSDYDGTKVFSNQEGFAKPAAEISANKGFAENLLQVELSKLQSAQSEYNSEGDNIKRNGLQRRIDDINSRINTLKSTISQSDEQLNQLFAVQESQQASKGNRTLEGEPVQNNEFGVGGIVASLFAKTLDNLGNYLNARAYMNMDMPKPLKDKAYMIDSNVDVSNQIQDIDTSKANVQSFVKQNITNPQLATSLIMGSEAETARQKTGIRSKANEIESQIRAANIGNLQRVSELNTNKDNQYLTDKFTKDVHAKVTMPSQNLANLAGDITSTIQDINLKEYQDKQLALEESRLGELAIFNAPTTKDMTESEYVQLLNANGINDTDVIEAALVKMRPHLKTSSGFTLPNWGNLASMVGRPTGNISNGRVTIKRN